MTAGQRISVFLSIIASTTRRIKKREDKKDASRPFFSRPTSPDLSRSGAAAGRLAVMVNLLLERPLRRTSTVTGGRDPLPARPRRSPKRAVLVVLCALLCGSPPVVGAEDGGSAEIVARVRALQKEIDDLLGQLPPDVRRRLEEELRGSGEVVPEAGRSEEATVSRPAPSEEAETKPVPPADEAIAELPGRSSGDDSAIERRPPRRRCTRLAPFDGNGDGQISAVDRYWRHLYVWQDRDGDGSWQDGEIRSAYEAGVRAIATDLDTFSRRKGALGEMRLRDGRVWLDLRGDGFGERGDDAVLMLDASALSRSGSGLLAGSGEQLAGMEPLRAGLQWRDAEGRVRSLDCP